MRLLHTADWQIGMKAVQAGERAEDVRRVRIETARSVIGLAKREAVEFVVLAGDTFEHNAPEPEYVAAIHDTLASASCPVLVLPGNHDRLEPGSIWLDNRWDLGANVVVLREPTARVFHGVQVLPCPLRSRRSNDNPTAWIRPGNRDRMRVVVAHGSIPDDVIGIDDHPIPLDAPEKTGADYLALGHWHSTRIYGKRMAYSGTHEQTKFGEENSGNVLLVEIDKPGAEPHIRSIKTGQLHWTRIGYDSPVTAAGELRRLREAIAVLPDPDRTLLDIKLTGLLFPSERTILDEIAADQKRFLYAREDMAGMRPAPDCGEWITDLPPGLIQKTAIRLRDLSVKPGHEGEVATESLLQLFHYAQEVLPC